MKSRFSKTEKERGTDGRERGRGTDASCFSFKRTPWKTSSFANENVHTILASFDKIKPLSFNVFWGHSTSAFPNSSLIVSTTHLQLLCSKSLKFAWRSSFFNLCNIHISNNIFWCSKILQSIFYGLLGRGLGFGCHSTKLVTSDSAFWP